MAYVLRVVQRYLPRDRAAFMQVEAEFEAMERARSDFPRGRRLQPLLRRQASSTLIWESEFETLAEVHAAIARLGSDEDHEILFRKQAPFIQESYMEVDEVLRF